MAAFRVKTRDARIMDPGAARSAAVVSCYFDLNIFFEVRSPSTTSSYT